MNSDNAGRCPECRILGQELIELRDYESDTEAAYKSRLKEVERENRALRRELDKLRNP